MSNPLARLFRRRRTKHVPPPPRAVIASHFVWDRQPFFVEANRKWGEVPGIPDIRCFFLQSCLRSLENVAGDVAECGVRHGKSALHMMEATERRRTFCLFDSFEGLSDPVPGKDTLETAFADGGPHRRFYNDDIDGLHARFAPFDNVRILQGWIPERFDEVADRTFCLVHIDVDLYEPTRDSLAFFYPRLAQHGIIVCDDYGSGAYPGARLALDEYFAERPETPIELPQGQAFIVKR